MENDYKRIVKCIEKALEESDGFDVSLPYEAVTRLVESSEKFHAQCLQAFQQRETELKDFELKLEEKAKKLESDISSKMQNVMAQTLNKINEAGEAAFRQTQQMLQKYSETGEIINRETDYEHLDVPLKDLNKSSDLNAELVKDIYKAIDES
jgi:hypothetical protein